MSAASIKGMFAREITPRTYAWAHTKYSLNQYVVKKLQSSITLWGTSPRQLNTWRCSDLRCPPPIGTRIFRVNKTSWARRIWVQMAPFRFVHIGYDVWWVKKVAGCLIADGFGCSVVLLFPMSSSTVHHTCNITGNQHLQTELYLTLCCLKFRQMSKPVMSEICIWFPESVFTVNSFIVLTVEKW